MSQISTEALHAGPIVQAIGLSKRFRVLKRKAGLVRAVDEISFDQAPRELVGYTGQNGAGIADHH